MTRPIKTIKRTKAMGNARYIVTRQGETMALLITEPVGLIPNGHELRRIVDSVPLKKPKRKMIRVWYFALPDGDAALFLNKPDARDDATVIGGCGPIESALIPAPRRKGEK